MLAKEQSHKTRRRANSEATEVPPTFNVEIMKETFHTMEINGIRFDTVKLFHPRPGKLHFLTSDSGSKHTRSGTRAAIYGRGNGRRHLSRQPPRALRCHF